MRHLGLSVLHLHCLGWHCIDVDVVALDSFDWLQTLLLNALVLAFLEIEYFVLVQLFLW